MRAIVIDRYGKPDVMQLRDVPVPEAQEGEVLIRVAYAGVNPSDSKTRAGVNRRADVTFPFVTGMDAADVVERTGRNVTEFREGDRVLTWGVPHKRHGALMRNLFEFPRGIAPQCRNA